MIEREKAPSYETASDADNALLHQAYNMCAVMLFTDQPHDHLDRMLSLAACILSQVALVSGQHDITASGMGPLILECAQVMVDRESAAMQRRQVEVAADGR
jgi:hypothetical protein